MNPEGNKEVWKLGVATQFQKGNKGGPGRPRLPRLPDGTPGHLPLASIRAQMQKVWDTIDGGQRLLELAENDFEKFFNFVLVMVPKQKSVSVEQRVDHHLTMDVALLSEIASRVINGRLNVVPADTALPAALEVNADADEPEPEEQIETINLEDPLEDTNEV